MPDYAKVVKYALNCKESVEKEYKLGVSTNYGYYFAKEILKPKTSVKQISIKSASKPSGNSYSRQVYKTTYMKLAEDMVKHVEKNYQMPDNLSYTSQSGKKITIRLRDLIYMFARILVFYDKEKAYPKYAELNTKCWIKPTEYSNVVYNYVYKKWGKAFKTIDELLTYVRANFRYESYNDDHKSNKQVTDDEAGNCVDLLQWLINMAIEMGYEYKVIHVWCRSSQVGHVFGQFRKKGTSEWFTRDIAAVADGESITSVWCQNGDRLATNPYWFMQNLNR